LYADGFNWGDEAEQSSPIPLIVMKNSVTTKSHADKSGTKQGTSLVKDKKADSLPQNSHSEEAQGISLEVGKSKCKSKCKEKSKEKSKEKDNEQGNTDSSPPATVSSHIP
jgi:hypothetical protein